MTRCGVVGSPIAHSLSPAIHRAAYASLGLDWTYDAHEVDVASFPSFQAELGEEWRGLSVTMPLKRVALETAARASDLAETVGAANTLVRTEAGAWEADNTDVPGVIAALTSHSVPRPSHVCLWGGGATASSVLAALALIEAGPVHVHVRSVERARPAFAIAAALGHPVEPAPWATTPDCRAADLTVSTVPAVAVEASAHDISATSRPGHCLFDVIYHPWPTPLATAWAGCGGAVVSGLDLLVHQAVGQVRLMTGYDVGADVLRAAAEVELAKRVTT